MARALSLGSLMAKCSSSPTSEKGKLSLSALSDRGLPLVALTIELIGGEFRSTSKPMTGENHACCPRRF